MEPIVELVVKVYKISEQTTQNFCTFLNELRGQMIDRIESDTIDWFICNIPAREWVHNAAKLPSEVTILSEQFSDWKTLDSHATEEGTVANKLVKELRVRQGLPEEF